MGFLRFIFIFIVVVYLLSLIFKFALKRFAKKVQRNFDNQQQEYKNQGKQEGEITVEYNKKKKKNSFDGDDDYVDYKEID